MSSSQTFSRKKQIIWNCGEPWKLSSIAHADFIFSFILSRYLNDNEKFFFFFRFFSLSYKEFEFVRNAYKLSFVKVFIYGIYFRCFHTNNNLIYYIALFDLYNSLSASAIMKFNYSFYNFVYLVKSSSWWPLVSF